MIDDMDTPEQEAAWLAGLRPDQAVSALASMATLVTILARDKYRGRTTTELLVDLPDFNERLHRLVGFISHAAVGNWTSSMAAGAVAQIEGLNGGWTADMQTRVTFMQNVRDNVERFGPK